MEALGTKLDQLSVLLDDVGNEAVANDESENPDVEDQDLNAGATAIARTLGVDLPQVEAHAERRCAGAPGALIARLTNSGAIRGVGDGMKAATLQPSDILALVETEWLDGFFIGYALGHGDGDAG